MEKDRSPVALVTGFTNRSLQIIINFFSNIIGGVEAPPSPSSSAVPACLIKGLIVIRILMQKKKKKFAHLWDTPLEPL